MKKIIIFILSLWPSLILASSLDNYYLYINVLENGDVSVETIIDTDKNPDYLEIPFDNYSNLKIMTVGNIPKSKNYDFSSLGVKEFTKTNKATTSDTDVYLLFKETNSTYLRIYNQNNTAYYFKYKIENSSLKHNDMGELNLNLLKDIEYPINNLSITINIPKNKLIYFDTSTYKDNDKEIENSKKEETSLKMSKKYVDDYLKLSYHHLEEKENIDLRIFFDKDLISTSNNLTNKDMLGEIKNLTKKKIDFDTIFKILRKIIILLSIIVFGILCYLMNKIILNTNYPDEKEIKTILTFKKNIIYLILGLLIVIFLLQFKMTYIILFILSIILYSYFYQQNKLQKKVIYLTTSFLLLESISIINVISLKDIISRLLFLLINLSLLNISYHQKINCNQGKSYKLKRKEFS